MAGDIIIVVIVFVFSGATRSSSGTRQRRPFIVIVGAAVVVAAAKSPAGFRSSAGPSAGAGRLAKVAAVLWSRKLKPSTLNLMTTFRASDSERA